METTGVLHPCNGCLKAKAKSKGVPKITSNKATQCGEQLCADISGPYKKSLIGNDYWILVVDDFTGKSWSFFAKKKTQMSTSVTQLISTLDVSGSR
jgi:hypothetical protein